MKNYPIINLPSNHKFGVFFFAIFAVLAAYSFWKVWHGIFLIALLVSVLLAATTLLAPKLLSPLNRFWFELGELIGKMVSPILLGFIFFVLITPVSLITRLFGRDELKMLKRSVNSYWVDRLPDGISSDSFKNQY
jgi:hypothetical protein